MVQDASQVRSPGFRPGWPGRAPRWLELASVVAALTIGLLNPLLCVLHCTVVAAPAQRAPLFVCHFGPATAEAASAPDSPAGAERPPVPRAVYEAVTPLLLVIALLALAGLLAWPASSSHTAEPSGPPSPPPRRAVAATR